MCNKDEKITLLLGVKADDTQMVSVTYENTSGYDSQAEQIGFYRVVCHSSYEPGSFVRTEIWLPEEWNGRFIGLGNGGMAGMIYPESLVGFVKLGYAAAQTDMGTSGGRNRGIDHPAVRRDFGWRATHGMTLLSKQLIRHHYGQLPEYSYFIGGSTGGQQAFSEAQRFPEDYDGIIAGVPANNRVALHTYFLWNHIHLTENGKALFSEEEIEKVTSCAVTFFQERQDGMTGDCFVSYPWLVAEPGLDTVEVFLQYLRQQGFSAGQLKALKAVYQGPVDSATGKQIYNGMPIGSERYGCGIRDCQQAESPHFYPFIWAFGENYNGRSFDFSGDYQ